MKIIGFAKKLNNTELGRAGMHDRYILIPRAVNVKDLFKHNEQYILHEKRTGKQFTIKFKEEREQRIYKMGEYYSENDLNAGDEVIIEKRIDGEQELFTVTCIKRDNIVVFQKDSPDFIVLNPERLAVKEGITDKNGNPIVIEKTEKRKQRKDAKELTQYYDIMINGSSIKDNYAYKEYGVLEYDGQRGKIAKFSAWRKYIVEMEEK